MAKNINQFFNKIKKNFSARERLVSSLRLIEQDINEVDFNTREEIIGPIMDLLFDKNEKLEFKLKNGLIFKFIYTSNIARDLLLNIDTKPDHIWEPQTTKLLLKLSKNAKNILIGGAYGGDQALLIAYSLRRKNCIIHCFEPNKKQSNLLKENFAINKLKNFHVSNYGLWNKDTSSLKLSNENDDSHFSPVEVKNNDNQSFKSITINKYLRDKKIKKLDLLMLDIEGGELNALEGAEQYLSMSKKEAPNIIFEIHSLYVDWSNGLRKTEVCKYLIKNNYILYAIRDYQSNVNLKGYPIELIPIDFVYLKGPKHGFNILAIKDENILNDKQFRIRKNVSPKLLKHRDPKIHSPRKK